MRLSNGEVLLGWPLGEHIITAGWTYNDGSAHNAIDLRATVGKPVYAAEDGTVNWVQHWNGSKTGNQSYGNLVRIRHADYNGQALETYYAHLSRTCVANGEKVAEGQLIGYSGESGNCFGAHLHFEVRVARVRYNPLNWLDADFRCANAQVQAHLGKYMSVVRPKEPEKPANKLQLITIGPITAQAAMSIWAKASELQLPYKSEWTDDAKTMQRLTIGPVSNGDAMSLWTLASVLGAPYSAEYAEV